MTIFEKIGKGEGKAFVIWENEKHIAFLDINPLTQGHTLVVPKENLGDYIFELNDQEYMELLISAKTVSKLLKAKMNPDRVLMWVEGFEVPHVHVHLIPADKDFNILEAEILQVKSEELAKTQSRILV
ncbi:MAG: HIT family protein [Candidatus Dojkabacteria bacterium]